MAATADEARARRSGLCRWVQATINSRRGKSSTGTHQPKSSPTSYGHYNSQVLQRPVEPNVYTSRVLELRRPARSPRWARSPACPSVTPVMTHATWSACSIAGLREPG